MNIVNRKLVKVLVGLSLVLPFVLGGLLSLFGATPGFDFNQGGSLFSLLLTSKGWLVFLVVAGLFFITGLLSVLLSRSLKPDQVEQPYSYASEPSDSDMREDGEVKWFNPNKGYGFITRSNGEEIFAHFRSIRGRGHRTLRQGQKVKFNAVEGEKGLQAEDISAV